MNKKQKITIASMAIIPAIIFTGTIDFSNSNTNAFAIQDGHHRIHTCTTFHPPFNCCPAGSFDCHCKSTGIDTVKCTYRLHRN